MFSALLLLVVTTPFAGGQESRPRLGAAIDILSDGSPPWEDRPIEVAGVGLLGGTAGVSDPGDDLGPDDRIVRTLDSVVYRLSYDVLDAPAAGLRLVAELPDGMVWQSGEETRLDLDGCPGGADISSVRRRLTCVVGDVTVPPAITGVVDAFARVLVEAEHGRELAARLTVTAADGRADPDPHRCPEPIDSGCAVDSEIVTVSAAPAYDTVKMRRNRPLRRDRDGVPGFFVQWRLAVLRGGDGDPRGDSLLAPDPIVLSDWWRSSTRDGTAVADSAALASCNSTPPDAFTCAQPGGPGTPIEIVFEPSRVPAGSYSTQPGETLVRFRTNYPLASLMLTLFVPLTDVEAAGGELRVDNCFATTPGDPSAAEFRPVDAAGNPNLGGLDEQLADNCAQHIIRVEPPAAPRVGVLEVSKRYAGPDGAGLAEVIAGETVDGIVRAESTARAAEPAFDDVMLCDAFDERTQRIAASDPRWLSPITVGGRVLEPEEYTLEFAVGPWGGGAPASALRGDRWRAQANAACHDSLPVNPEGWVGLDELDVGGSGVGLSPDDVNAIRVRLRDPLHSRGVAVLRGPLTVRDVPTGTLLINYGSAHHTVGGAGKWTMGGCYGVEGSTCPDPPQLLYVTKVPGPIGDALIVVEAPTRLRKDVGPLNESRYTAAAGETIDFRLRADVTRSGDPLPPGAIARSAIIRDHLPVGLAFVPGSARRKTEDINGDGVLQPTEDINGNGVLDYGGPIDPTVLPDTPGPGETTLLFHVGDIAPDRYPLVISYRATVDRLVAGGTSLVNGAHIRSLGEGRSGCFGSSSSPRHPSRCASAEVQVSNTSRAAVEKTQLAVTDHASKTVGYRLRAANLTRDPIEWLDAVDILPWAGDDRDPPTRFAGSVTGITVTVTESVGTLPLEVWASATAPEVLDTMGGSLPDGVVDPVRGWGAPAAGLGGPDWPCPLADVGTAACPDIAGDGDVTALRFWAPDPDPADSGSIATSRLPVAGSPIEIVVLLALEGVQVGDLLHNAWGGRFEGMVLPAFDSAIARPKYPMIYLPVALKNFTISRPPTLDPPCEPRPLALSIVLDASTSMRQPSGIGGTKIDTVISAATELIDAILDESPRNQVALAAFNETAWTIQSLTSYPPRLHAALAGLRNDLDEGTRLDLGLLAGAELLAVSPFERKAMIFLTDGLPNRVPTPIPSGRQEDTVLAAAAEIRALGITIHTVGYGRPDAPEIIDRVHPELLAGIAGAEGTSHIAPDAAALEAAFRAIGAELRCPVE